MMASSQAILSRHACRGLRLFGRNVAAHSTAVASEIVPKAPAAAVVAPSFKANLDFKFVKDNVQLVVDNCKARNSNADPVRVVQLYDEFTRLKQESDSLRASRNENSAAMKVIGGAFDCGGSIHFNAAGCLRAPGGWAVQRALRRRAPLLARAAQMFV